MDLAEFLLARIAEDEYQATGQAELIAERYGETNSELGYQVDRGYWLQVSPTRALAECEAKRRIAEEAARLQTIPLTLPEDMQYVGARQALLQTCRLLALPYADHPDYDEAWRPAVSVS